MAKMVFLTSFAFSNLCPFAKTFISRRNSPSNLFFLPSKNSRIWRIIFAYSCLEISPVHTPGQSPICRLKHADLLPRDSLFVKGSTASSEEGFKRPPVALSGELNPPARGLATSFKKGGIGEGVHLSRKGKIRRMILSAILKSVPLVNGPYKE